MRSCKEVQRLIERLHPYCDVPWAIASWISFVFPCSRCSPGCDAVEINTSGRRHAAETVRARQQAKRNDAFSTAASCSRICFCWCGGKTEMMLSPSGCIHRAAWRRPDGRSAAVSAVSISRNRAFADQNHGGPDGEPKQGPEKRLRIDFNLALIDDRFLSLWRNSIDPRPS